VQPISVCKKKRIIPDVPTLQAIDRPSNPKASCFCTCVAGQAALQNYLPAINHCKHSTMLLWQVGQKWLADQSICQDNDVTLLLFCSPPKASIPASHQEYTAVQGKQRYDKESKGLPITL
jgi:hypothetical protein